jgi:hypothetical protein
MSHEPQITAIASYIADKMPAGEAAPSEVVDTWRTALRYARSTGTIDELARAVASADPNDPRLQELLAEAAS